MYLLQTPSMDVIPEGEELLRRYDFWLYEFYNRIIYNSRRPASIADQQVQALLTKIEHMDLE